MTQHSWLVVQTGGSTEELDPLRPHSHTASTEDRLLAKSDITFRSEYVDPLVLVGGS